MFQDLPSQDEVQGVFELLRACREDAGDVGGRLLARISDTQKDLLPVIKRYIVDEDSYLQHYALLAAAKLRTNAVDLVPLMVALAEGADSNESLVQSSAIHALAHVPCGDSIAMLRKALVSEDEFVQCFAASSVKYLGEHMKELVPLLRNLARRTSPLKQVLEEALSNYYQSERLDNAKMLEEFEEGRVHLVSQDRPYLRGLHHVRDIDLMSSGLLVDRDFPFLVNGIRSHCRLFIGRNDRGSTAVFFSKDNYFYGCAVPTVVADLASTVKQVYPDLSFDTRWFDHWSPTSGLTNVHSLEEVTFKLDESTGLFSSPQWTTIQYPLQFAIGFKIRLI